MAFQHLEWLLVAVPARVLLLAWRFWRRRYWRHSLVKHFGEETSWSIRAFARVVLARIEVARPLVLPRKQSKGRAVSTTA